MPSWTRGLDNHYYLNQSEWVGLWVEFEGGLQACPFVPD